MQDRNAKEAKYQKDRFGGGLEELIKGSLQPLPGLEKKHLFNAENLTISEQRRLFVTGSKGVYEILRPDGVNYEQQEVPITAENVPTTCLRTGIVSYGDSLYLLCVHIHPGSNSTLKDLCNVADEELTLWKAFFLYGRVLKKCQIDSYLLRADLSASELEFADGFALRSKMQAGERIRLESVREGMTRLGDEDIKLLANGLAVDEKGALYIANSNHNASKEGSVGIMKVEVNSTSPLTATQIAWLQPKKGAPNGVQVQGTTLYYTDNASLTGRLLKVALEDTGKIEQQVYKKFWSMFDDFTCAESTFVIADFLNDSLRFISEDGALLGSVKNGGLKNPSSAAFVEESSQLFEAGVILVTEIGRHRLSMLSQ